MVFFSAVCVPRALHLVFLQGQSFHKRLASPHQDAFFPSPFSEPDRNWMLLVTNMFQMIGSLEHESFDDHFSLYVLAPDNQTSKPQNEHPPNWGFITPVVWTHRRSHIESVLEGICDGVDRITSPLQVI